MTATIKSGYVKHDDGSYYVQLPSRNRYGFSLFDDDGQSYPGGLGLGNGEWALVSEGDVPEDRRESLAWLLEE